MKFIQTFLSACYLNNELSDQWWSHEKYRCYSFALSSHQLVKHDSDVTLVTDKKGKELLIDIFKLPYRNVHIALDEEMNQMPVVTDGLAKIFSWSLPDAPFIFVDETVFLWNALPEESLHHTFLTFAEERNSDPVLKGLYALQKVFNDIPAYLLNEGHAKLSFSTRIVGGTDERFKHYYSFVKDLITERIGHEFQAKAFSSGEIDPVFLDYFILQFCRLQSIPVKRLFDFAIDDRHFTPFTVFDPIHPDIRLSYIASGLKSDQNTQSNLSFILQSLYPDTHEKIDRYFSKIMEKEDTTATNSESLDERNFFVRTFKAIEILSQPSAHGATLPGTVRALETFIHCWPESEEGKLIQDAFAFEKAKYEYHSTIASSEFRLSRQKLKLNDYRKLFLEQDMDIYRSVFVCGEDIQVVETQWKWGVYTHIQALYPLRVVYNCTMPSEYFQTLLVFNPDINAITEYDLEQFDMLLLDAFRNPSSLEGAFAYISQYFEEGREGVEMLKPFALARFKELFFMGAIVLTR